MTASGWCLAEVQCIKGIQGSGAVAGLAEKSFTWASMGSTLPCLQTECLLQLLRRPA